MGSKITEICQEKLNEACGHSWYVYLCCTYQYLQTSWKSL